MRLQRTLMVLLSSNTQSMDVHLQTREGYLNCAQLLELGEIAEQNYNYCRQTTNKDEK